MDTLQTRRNASSGSYARYKSATEHLLRWLLDNSGASATDRLRTADLARMMDEIEQQSIAVPPDVLESAKRAATGRTRCADYFRRLESTDLCTAEIRDSNIRHRHFADAMKDVYRRLLGCPKAQQAAGPVRTTTSNAYDALYLFESDDEEVSDEVPATADTTLTEQPSARALTEEEAAKRRAKNKTRKCAISHKKHADRDEFHDSCRLCVEARNQQLLEDRFQAWCLLSDMAEIRDLVRGYLKDWTHGKLSTLTLMRLIDESFILLGHIASGSTWENFAVGFILGIVNHNDTSEVELADGIAQEETKLRNMFCPRSYHALMNFVMYPSRGQDVPQAQREMLKGTTGQVYTLHPFVSVLCDAVDGVESLAASTVAHEGIYRDYFTRGLQILRQDKVIPLWLVFACDIYMDLYEHAGFSTAWMAKQCDDLQTSMLHPLYLQASQETLPQAGAAALERSGLLNTLPILRWKQLINHICQQNSFIRTWFIVQHATISTTVLLYDDVRQTSPNTVSWPDLDILLQLQPSMRRNAKTGFSPTSRFYAMMMKPHAELPDCTTSAGNVEILKDVGQLPGDEPFSSKLLECLRTDLVRGELSNAFPYVAFGERCVDFIKDVQAQSRLLKSRASAKQRANITIRAMNALSGKADLAEKARNTTEVAFPVLKPRLTLQGVLYAAPGTFPSSTIAAASTKWMHLQRILDEKIRAAITKLDMSLPESERRIQDFCHEESVKLGIPFKLSLLRVQKREGEQLFSESVRVRLQLDGPAATEMLERGRLSAESVELLNGMGMLKVSL